MREQLPPSCRCARTILFPRTPSKQGSSERLHGVRHDALGADRIDSIAEPKKPLFLYMTSYLPTRERDNAVSSDYYARVVP